MAKSNNLFRYFLIFSENLNIFALHKLQKMKKIITSTLIYVIIITSLNAQKNLGGKDNYHFFNKKFELYQKWLKKKGLGSFLKTDTFRISENETELELFLSIQTNNVDSAAAMWLALKDEIEETHPWKDLKSLLYETFIEFMEIPSSQGNIQIYVPKKDGSGYDPCFYVWIWEEDFFIEEKERINNCKSEEFKIKVKPPRISISSDTLQHLSNELSTDYIFDEIIAFVKKKYQSQKCYNRYPKVVENDRSKYMLKFTVNDLCQEVLVDEEKSLWCNFVEYWWGPCNDIRRERLKFTFHIVPKEQGFNLYGEMKGKFGSGVYKPRQGHYMDMEPDFEFFLKSYKSDFKIELENFLEKN